MHIHQVIREVRDNNPSVLNPHALAELVFAEVTDTATALHQLLPEACSQFLSNNRVPSYASTGGQGSQGTQSQLAAGGPAPSNGVRRPSKQQLYREAWRRKLEANLWFGPDSDGRKQLRHCTSDDLRLAASFRRRLAVTNELRAQNLERLAKAMDAARAATFENLPKATQRELLDGVDL